MKSITFSDILKSRAFLPCLLFFIFNAWYSYDYYQINVFKIYFVGMMVTLLFIMDDVINIFTGKDTGHHSWKTLLILAMPLFGSLPGLLIYAGEYNYTSIIQLPMAIFAILWASYLIRRYNEESFFTSFIAVIAGTVIFVSIWGFLEKFGINIREIVTNSLIDMTTGQTNEVRHLMPEGPQARVKSTYGNSNYFAGFLIIIMPLLCTMAIPEFMKKGPGTKKSGGKDKTKFAFSPVSIIAGTAFIFGLISIYFTGTRSATVAFLLSLTSIAVLYIFIMIPKDLRKKILIPIFIVLVISIITLVILKLNYPDNYLIKRYLSGLKAVDTGTRYIGWTAALSSFFASPIIGYGLGSSYNLFFLFVRPDYRLFTPETSFSHAHSEILEYLQESGILGYIIFLAFWIIIFRILIKTINDNNADIFWKKLAFGILGGIIAYHIHSIFSVAPRKMVVKLPLYTLVGFTLCLPVVRDKISSAQIPKLKVTYSNICISIVLLLISWFIFVPYANSLKEFTEIYSRQKRGTTIEDHENTIYNYPSAYGLKYLLYEQLKYGRIVQAENTIKKIKETIPNYRDTGAIAATIELKKNDIDSAFRKALEYEKYDRYYENNNNLIATIASLKDDRELFVKQIEKHLELWLILHRSDNIDSPEKVSISITDSDIAAEFMLKNGSFKARFSSKFIEKLMYIISQHNSGNFEKEITNSLYTELRQSIGKSKYLWMVLEGKSPAERDKIMNYIQRYYLVSNARSKLVNKEKKNHMIQLMRAGTWKKPFLKSDQLERARKAAGMHDNEWKAINKYLKNAIDFRLFTQRKAFLERFLNWTRNIMKVNQMKSPGKH